MRELGRYGDLDDFGDSKIDLPPFDEMISIGRIWGPEGSVVVVLGKTAEESLLEKHRYANAQA